MSPHARGRRKFAAVAIVVLVVSSAFWAYASVRLMRHFARVNVPSGKLERLGHFERLVRIEPTATSWRGLADSLVENGQFSRASSAYEEAASIYRRRGDLNAAYVLDRFSQRFETRIEPFFHERTRPNDVREFFSGARLEPIYGCYTGAFIDHEDSIRGTYRDEYGELRKDVSAFNHLVGSKQAIFFMYQGYGRVFPKAFVQHLAKFGASAQIALEPTDISEVEDDEYLGRWAKAARDSHVPIFLRFASEMNGDWVSYHKDPALYIEKFRLVARVMHEVAPNVAMVWCPFEIPERFITDFFPGDDVVDWVGVNIYSVPFNDNDPNRSGLDRNPADQLRYIYGLYAGRHPIMIAEYAASHMSSLDRVNRDAFACDKIGQLYSGLPRLYPRVKAVCWLSMNAIRHAIPGRQRNDYSLLEDYPVRKRYEQMLYSPYYLSKVPIDGHPLAEEEIAPLRSGAALRGKVGLSAWVKTYVERPTVVWKVNGEERLRSDLPGPYHWTLDTQGLPNGPATIELMAFDNDGRLVGDEVRTLTIENG